MAKKKTAKRRKDPPPCEHKGSKMWKPAMNEEGWHCADCDAPLGFRPDLDERDEFLEEKIEALLFWLNHHGLIYVSSGEHGSVITACVGQKCVATGYKDQRSIIEFIVTEPNLKGNGPEFWKERREETLKGGADGG